MEPGNNQHVPLSYRLHTWRLFCFMDSAGEISGAGDQYHHGNIKYVHFEKSYLIAEDFQLQLKISKSRN